MWYSRWMAEPEVRLFVERVGPPDPETSLLVEQLWVESSLGDGWIAAFRLLPQAGQMVVGEVRIFPNEGHRKPRPGESRRRTGQWSAAWLGLDAEAPLGGLTARTVRRVSFQEARSAFTEALAQLVEKHGSETPLPPLDPFLEGIRMDDLAEQARTRPGQGGRDDRFYAAIAANYVARARSGGKQPVRELAAELRRPASHVRQLLATARERGLLSRGVQGRAGGELTEAGRAALAPTGDARR
jgi:hypothetical protein